MHLPNMSHIMLSIHAFIIIILYPPHVDVLGNSVQCAPTAMNNKHACVLYSYRKW